MSSATPTPADWQLAQPFIDAFRAVEGSTPWLVGLARRDYWHGVQDALRAAHPGYSGHDVTRVARIMAPFPLRDGAYAPR